MAGESELLQGIDSLDVSLFTEVSVLEEPDFIDRYAGVIGLRGTVMLGNFYTASDRWPVHILRVYPYSWEQRIAATADAFTRFGDEDGRAKAEEYYGTEPLAMTEDEIDEVADRIRNTKEKKVRYEKLSRLQKIAQNLRFLTGRESCVISVRDEIQARLPDVIAIQDEEKVLKEVAVSKVAEEKYKSLPPNNWRNPNPILS